jgi:hypothetical protein
LTSTDIGADQYEAPPGVATLPASPIAQTSATLNGTVNPNGAPSGQLVSAAAMGLTPGTLYYFQLAATNATGSKSAGPATFTTLSASQRTLTVRLAGAGSGTVTGTGISCPGNCSHSYPSGASLTLTPAAKAGSRFAGWSGGCAGRGRCSLTITANQTVTATFVRSAKCTLKPNGDRVLLKRPKKSGKTSKATPGTLSVKVRCDQAVRVTLTGTLTEAIGKKPKHGKQRTKRFRLGPVRKSVRAGVTYTLVLKLPKPALSGLKQHAPESVTLLLVWTNANGSGRTTATIARLRAS